MTNLAIEREKAELSAEINKLIKEFVDQVTTLARRRAVASLTAAFGGNGAAYAPSRVGKRSSHDIEQLKAKLVEHIASNPGQRIDRIGSAFGLSTRELNLPLRKLVKAGVVRTQGQKRATTYFPERNGQQKRTRR